MKSNNPVLTRLPQAQQNTGYANPQAGYPQQSPYGQTQYGQQPNFQQPGQAYSQGAERPITVDDIVTKTGITLAVIVAFAVVTFGIGMVNPGIAMFLTFVGAIGGFITVLVHSFGRKYGSAAVTLIYAVFEGLFVGGFSLVLSGFMVGGENAGAIIFQAILGTIGVFAGMLFVYKTGAIRVTPKFTRIITGCIIGIAVLALGNLLLFIFTGMSPLRDGGPIAIIFSLVCIVLGALSFLSDFDTADKLVRTGAPAKMAWGVALGLAVTLVWLYTEILRLLSYFRD
ncbi:MULTISPECIES: Bax inhibitor-1/YccA family protein [unclassified Corynebacterium]|uniref:Bax inhibitor-1/YccA family protein n=1 Tax=unclassified Corynebacterium TaxID=2624378 RepID=UPI002655AA95|nr:MULTISPECIES: Bax inhibitor-1/YccA family protein [unclassified Corynebacterium]MDN8594922.1 Bax inhibitor-1/YccA family protein [Corynebacterium sp. P4_F2]WKK56440.1 Bax inhibitor-1/YccA family protein [Corynebacterium sp. P4-C1]WKK63873.1 Bax inhibitor-1/YccA family protein [Corynebacterium sp. P8-C1]